MICRLRGVSQSSRVSSSGSGSNEYLATPWFGVILHALSPIAFSDPRIINPLYAWELPFDGASLATVPRLCPLPLKFFYGVGCQAALPLHAESQRNDSRRPGLSLSRMGLWSAVGSA